LRAAVNLGEPEKHNQTLEISQSIIIQRNEELQKLHENWPLIHEKNEIEKSPIIKKPGS